MKVRDGFILRNMGDSYLVVPVGSATVDFRCIITLNGTGAFLWELLQDECAEEELVKALLSEYEVAEDVAARDVAGFVEELRKADLLV